MMSSPPWKWPKCWFFFARRRREKNRVFWWFSEGNPSIFEVKHAIFSLRRRRRAQKSVKITQNPGFWPIWDFLRRGGFNRGGFYRKLYWSPRKKSSSSIGWLKKNRPYPTRIYVRSSNPGRPRPAASPRVNLVFLGMGFYVFFGS